MSLTRVGLLGGGTSGLVRVLDWLMKVLCISLKLFNWIPAAMFYFWNCPFFFNAIQKFTPEKIPLKNIRGNDLKLRWLLRYYDISKNTAYELAALQAQATFGVNKADFWTNGLLLDKIQHYLPFRMLEGMIFFVFINFVFILLFWGQDKTACEVKILTYHGSFENLEKHDAYRRYLEKLVNIDTIEEVYGGQVSSLRFARVEFCSSLLVANITSFTNQTTCVNFDQNGIWITAEPSLC